jgi:hypothetical protein
MILLIFTFKMGNFLQSFQSFDIWPFKLYIYYLLVFNHFNVFHMSTLLCHDPAQMPFHVNWEKLQILYISC